MRGGLVIVSPSPRRDNRQHCCRPTTPPDEALSPPGVPRSPTSSGTRRRSGCAPRSRASFRNISRIWQGGNARSRGSTDAPTSGPPRREKAGEDTTPHGTPRGTVRPYDYFERVARSAMLRSVCAATGRSPSATGIVHGSRDVEVAEGGRKTGDDHVVSRSIDEGAGVRNGHR